MEEAEVPYLGSMAKVWWYSVEYSWSARTSPCSVKPPAAIEVEPNQWSQRNLVEKQSGYEETE
jgi:hypothetical protein